MIVQNVCSFRYRGENRPACYVFKPVEGEPNKCHFVCILNTDLKVCQKAVHLFLTLRYNEAHFSKKSARKDMAEQKRWLNSISAHILDWPAGKTCRARLKAEQPCMDSCWRRRCALNATPIYYPLTWVDTPALPHCTTNEQTKLPRRWLAPLLFALSFIQALRTRCNTIIYETSLSRVGYRNFWSTKRSQGFYWITSKPWNSTSVIVIPNGDNPSFHPHTYPACCRPDHAIALVIDMHRLLKILELFGYLDEWLYDWVWCADKWCDRWRWCELIGHLGVCFLWILSREVVNFWNERENLAGKAPILCLWCITRKINEIQLKCYQLNANELKGWPWTFSTTLVLQWPPNSTNSCGWQLESLFRAGVSFEDVKKRLLKLHCAISYNCFVDRQLSCATSQCVLQLKICCATYFAVELFTQQSSKVLVVLKILQTLQTQLIKLFLPVSNNCWK